MILRHTVCCHYLPPGLAVPLTSSVMHEKSFCTTVALLVSPVALSDVPEAGTGVKHAGLMSRMWSLAGLYAVLVTTARAGSKPAAVQLSEQTRPGLFRKQRTPTPKGRVALPNTLALASTSTCCFHSRVNALSEPRGSQHTCGSDSPACIHGRGHATATATALRWMKHRLEVQSWLAPNVASEVGSRPVHNSSSWC